MTASAADGKPPCRVCTDFRQTMRQTGFGTLGSRGNHAESNSAGSEHARSKRQESAPSSSHSQENASNQQQQLPSDEDQWNLTECPPDSLELGHSSWTLLHSMAAYYPSQPDPNTQQQCLNFLGALPTLYPCNYCAKHLGEEMKRMPPSCESREALEQWMCTMHNIVNKRLGKPEFDCTRVGQRWRDGC